MADNFSNFHDFLDLKSPDILRMDSHNSDGDFLRMSDPKYELSSDFLMNLDTQVNQNNALSTQNADFQSKFESMSTKSGHSTNYSSKNSPDYELCDRESSGKSEFVADKWSQNPPIQKKKISKNYEPLFDGKTWFKYEDNPAEYKKARKRIQNRESATRVRNRKKNYVEVVEQDVYSLKKENTELQLKNAALTAENNLLKQQISFLERMVMNSNPNASLTNIPEPSNNSRFILPMQKDDARNDSMIEEPKLMSGGFMRMASNQTFKRHATMLGVVTLLLCVFGTMGGDIAASTGASGGLSVEAFSKSLSMTLLSLKDGDTQTDSNDKISLYTKQMQQSIHNYIQDQEKSLTSQTFKIGVGILYALYFGYVCLVAKQTVLRGKVKYF